MYNEYDMLQCDVCEYKTVHSGTLTAHIRKHTSDMLQCDVCEYKTTWSDLLTAHMRKHTGDNLISYNVMFANMNIHGQII